MKMKARIHYWKDIEKWYMDVMYHKKLPSLDDIKRDYVELPITIDIKDETELGKIFYTLNCDNNPMGAPEYQQWIRDNNVHHTSMSVGDVAQLGDRYYICKNIGWEEIKI